MPQGRIAENAMKKIVSAVLAVLMIFTFGSEIMSVFQLEDLALFAKALTDSTETGDDSELDGFSAELLQLLNEYPTENAYSQIIIDVEANTIQKDNDEAVSLDNFDADYSAVETAEPVLPVIAVLETAGVEAELDSETGEVVADYDGETVSNSFAGDIGEVKDGIFGEILDNTIEDGVQTIVTSEGSVKRAVGYMTEEQAEESFNLESEYENGKITVTNPYQTKRLCVHMKSGKKLAQTYSAVKAVNDGSGFYVLQFKTESDAKAAYEKIARRNDVESVSCDQIVSVTAAAIPNRAGAKLIQSDRYKKYLNSKSKKSSVVVAVVDTGVDSAHAFLKSRMLKGKNFSASGKQTNTGDKNGHGTHVAGIVVDNTPSNVKILPVKVLEDNGSGSSLNVALGIKYAASHGADVINMSLGGVCHGSCEIDKAVKQAIEKGVTVCVASGNETCDAKSFCPAKIKKCITVAASEIDGNSIAVFSNYGASVDVTAPGVGISSCKPGGGYVKMSGTSQATPFASAAAAMILTNNPKLTPAKVEEKLKSTCADMLIKGWDKHSGAGLLNFGILLGDKKTYPQDLGLEQDGYETEFISKHIPFRCNTVVYNDKAICTDRSVTVKSSNPAVAEYDGRFVTPKKSGKTVITVSLPNGKSKTLTLNLTRTETWLDYAAKSYAGGKGTKKSPYLISNAEQLAKFAYDVRTDITANGKCYKLTKDINLKGKKWITAAYINPDTLGQIAFSFDGSEDFRGIFDGNNHIIKNMDVLDTHITNVWTSAEFTDNIWYPQNSGFVDIVHGGTIKNLGIVNGSCYDSDSGILARGVFQGSRISDCFTTGFSAGNGFVGQITNYDIVVKNCFSSASTVGSGFTQEIYSSKTDGNVTVQNCFFCGEILDNDYGKKNSAFSDSIESNKGFGHTKVYNCFAVAGGVAKTGFARTNKYSTVKGCYYLKNSGGIKSNNAPKKTSLKAKPAKFFKTKSSYTKASNWDKSSSWDFKNTWAIDPKINNGYPYLKKMPFTSSTVSNTGTWLDYAAKSFAGGNGTAKSPYLISNAKQLARVAYFYRYGGGEGVHFKLTKDIDLSGKLWYPIGGGSDIDIICGTTDWIDRKVFKGSIDGNGKTISNMTVKSRGNLVGFISIFGMGTIKNLNFTNADVRGNENVGIICGESRIYGKLLSCKTSGKVTAAEHCGGISGLNSSLAEIIGCSSSAKVKASSEFSFAGGIVGENGAVLEKCFFNGTLEGGEYLVGGICGHNVTAINNCYATGDSISENDCYNCYAYGKNEFTVYDSSGKENRFPISYIGKQSSFKGFDFTNTWYMSDAGRPALKKVTQTAQETKLPTKYWTTAKSFAGGSGTKDDPYLIATPGQLVRVITTLKNGAYYRLIKNINLKGKLWPTHHSGSYYVTKFYFDGNNKTVSNLTMKDGDGLFNVQLNKGYIKRLNLKNVSGRSSCSLLAALGNAKISDCSVTGSFSAPISTSIGAQMKYVSGLVGIVYDGFTIERCSVNVNVKGYRNVAGLVSYGQPDKGSVKDCSVRGTFYGYDGGFISGNGTVNGLCRRSLVSARCVFYGDPLADCKIYYNKDLAKSVYGKPLTTAKMKSKASYADFDFKNVWAIDKDKNGGYPYLRKAASKTITYKLNGGKAPYLEKSYIPGNTVTLQKPKKSGYVFSGWYKKADFSGKPITKISSSEKGNITLYAKWKKA